MRERSEIGKFLAIKRVEKGITQTEMAEILGVKGAYLSAVERGVKGFGLAFAAKLYALPVWSEAERVEVLVLYMRYNLKEFDLVGGDLIQAAERIERERNV